MSKKVYSGVDTLPTGHSQGKAIKGCIVLEGGAFRGVYTSGVLDALMLNGINMEYTVGVSAGALNGMGYVSGQIGRCGRINLKYRRDSRYVSIRKMYKHKGVIGFDFCFYQVYEEPFDYKQFFSGDMKFIAVATNMNTGEAEYMCQKDFIDIFGATRASASMPYVSKPVMINGQPYLDGGCAVKIAYEWPIKNDFDKIIVVRTRTTDFRYELKKDKKPAKFYKKYPEFVKSLEHASAKYNEDADILNKLHEEGSIFQIAPSKDLGVGRLEKDMEKLGELYWLGYNDAMANMDALKAYLGI